MLEGRAWGKRLIIILGFQITRVTLGAEIKTRCPKKVTCIAISELKTRYPKKRVCVPKLPKRRSVDAKIENTVAKL